MSVRAIRNVKRRQDRKKSTLNHSISFTPLGDNDSSLAGDSSQSEYDEIVHPKHYKNLPNGVECWDVTQFMTANIAQAMKYQWRAGLKPDQSNVKDLKKAIQFLQHEIDLLEGNFKKMQ